jgi:N-acyl-D-amino-acid deacylase
VDIIITNGKIIDGTGAPWFKADLGIRDGKIVRIGKLQDASASRIIDAEGLYVTPGFVDNHSHGDFSILKSPEMKIKVLQGVTTQLDGQCGMSVAPLEGEALSWAEKSVSPLSGPIMWRSFEDFFRKVEEKGAAINTAYVVGHGTVRLCVLGYDARKPTETELAEMKQLIRESMAAGCIGMSTGLVYPPGYHATTEEIVELCGVVAEYDGIYTSHVRGDRETQIESAQELLDVAEKASIPTVFSHIEAKYPKHSPSFQKWKLAMLEEARSRGIDITADTHEVTWTGVADVRWILPYPWRVMNGDELVEVLRDPNERQKVIADFNLSPYDPRAKGGPFGLTQSGAWNRVKIYRSKVRRELEGKTIREIAKEQEKPPEEVLLDLFVDDGGTGPFLLLRYIESDLSTTAAHPLVAPVMTDLFCSNPEDKEGDAFELIPEWLGIFPDFLKRFVLERRYVSLEEGIRKITSMPLRMMRIWDRGIVRPGFWADLVAFDAELLDVGSTLETPRKHPEGIEYVFVNGRVVVEKGEYTGSYPGKLLRRK